MSGINGVISAEAIVNGVVQGQVGVGRHVINDYTLTLTEIDEGYRLEIRRGSETQAVELRGLAASKTGLCIADGKLCCKYIAEEED